MKLKTLVFISGSGTNLQALIDHSKANLLPIDIIQVVSNQKDVMGLERAEKAKIPTLVLTKKMHQSRKQYDEMLLKQINKLEYDLIVCAGWMHILSSEFLSGIHKNAKIINLHPALPGMFPGKDAMEQAWESYQRGETKDSGLMVHEVVPEVDAGRVLMKQRVPIYGMDTFQTFEERMRYYEKPLLLQAIQKVYQEMIVKNKPLRYNLSAPYKKGKVRDIYDIGYNMLLMVQTDRQSAFDRYICDVPDKGRILTRASTWWFNQTRNIIGNHLIHSEGNMMLVKKAKPIPLEIVVRAYMTGTTSTSIWTHYQKNPEKPYCGINISSLGLIKNERLPEIMVTPTTKSKQGDELITPEEIVEKKILNQEVWDYVKQKALDLFKYGKSVANMKDLILADTKYEFGILPNGELILIDEIHTCDSSRYWRASSYLEKISFQQEPESFDKDIIRRYIREHTDDPYLPNPLPKIDSELIDKAKKGYEEFFNIIVGEELPENYPKSTGENRLKLVEGYMNNYYSPMVVILTKNSDDMEEKIKKFQNKLKDKSIYGKGYLVEGLNQMGLIMKIIQKYNKDNEVKSRKIIYATMDRDIANIIEANSNLPVVLINNQEKRYLGNNMDGNSVIEVIDIKTGVDVIARISS